MIDTLIFSGGGPSGILYLGVLNSFLKKNLIDDKLTGIKEIITTSVGILFSFCLLIGIKYDVIYFIVMKYNIENIINLDDISIDNILIDFGLFKMNEIKNLFQSLIKNILHKDDITLYELYEKTKIKLTVKVFNVTKTQTEYISHETYPELSIITLAQMTMAIPFFFQPIQYNDNLYVDGGLRGGFPIEKCQSDNFIGIHIKSGMGKNVFTAHPFINYIFSMMFEKEEYDINDKRILILTTDQGLSFDLSNDKKNLLIQTAYDKTCLFIDNLTKD